MDLPQKDDALEGFKCTEAGITCRFIKTTSSGDLVLLEVDTSSPYAEFKAQRLNKGGEALASFSITRAPREEDGFHDNWYVMTGFDRRLPKQQPGDDLLTYYGSNTDWERMDDLKNLY